jgi:hypothetical protein
LWPVLPYVEDMQRFASGGNKSYCESQDCAASAFLASVDFEQLGFPK